MHFKLTYVIDGMRVDLDQDEVLNFSYGGEHRVLVRVLHSVDENDPTRKTLICEGLSEREVEDSVVGAFQRFSAGGPLDVTQRSFFNKVLSELHDSMQETVVTLRWRCNITGGPISPLGKGKDYYSFDGVIWHEASRLLHSVAMLFGDPYPKDKISEALCEEIVALVEQGASESLERQLFREAWNLRAGFPKAALVIGIAAVEIGFRRLVGPVRGKKGILTLLKWYWPGPSRKYRGREIKPSVSIRKVLKKGIHKRDSVVHNGAAAPKPDELRDILWNIDQLLWIWDFYSGHVWALEHLSANSVSK